MDDAANSSVLLDRLLSPLADCFVAESARRLLALPRRIRTSDALRVIVCVYTKREMV